MKNIDISIPTDWQDYELIDSGDGEKLERYGKFMLRRPDPQILWQKSQPETVWKSADAAFNKTHGDKGVWHKYKSMPEHWPMHWQDVTANIRLSPFKHTGVFPEQAAHWLWMKNKISANKTENHQPNVLNLFSYTGMASVVCAKAGAKVTHVDASKASVTWAKQNQLSSKLDERSIRWILDDVLKFVRREVKRGNTYDGIIMDPPIYGHGPTGEVWDFKIHFPVLLDLCTQILSDKPLFMIINAYAISTSSITLGNVLEEKMRQYKGNVETGELVLQESQSKRMLSTGIYARWGR